jgi:hypothetical protein
MKRGVLAGLAFTCGLAHADEQADAIQRALIERDRQSAEFARPALRDADSARDQMHLPLRPDERQVQAREREAQSASGAQLPASAPDYRPLPLPGGPRHGVDPIPLQGLGG